MKRKALRDWAAWPRRLPGVVPAIVFGGSIVLSRVALEGLLGPASPFILAWPAIMIAAFFGGFWPAIAIAFLGLGVGQWALATGGAHALRIGGMVIFMAFGLVFAVTGEARKRSLRRAAADAARLSDMERRLAAVARLNAMGEIAATLAHELNQPLTAIASYAGAAQRLVGREGPQSTAVSDLLDKVASQAARARGIIGRIRGYVAQGELALTPQSLSGMFDEAVAIAMAGGGALTVRRDFDPTADRVLADRIQIQQVMVNLVRNAAEAMAHAPRRDLGIGGRRGADGFIEAYVSDTGPGLAPDVAQRLFEPFVSGKPDGMGIGLAVSRSIVEAHRGEIHVEPRAAGGVVFRFTLQAAPV